MEGTVLVDGRNAARKLEALGVHCDAKEIPELPGGERPAGWWILASTEFQGEATPQGTLSDPVEVSLSGPAAVLIDKERLVGILSPNSVNEPALWWAWPLSALEVGMEGSQGFLKKRPTTIFIEHGEDILTISDVSRLYRNSGSYQSGQETSFFKALSK